MKSGAMILSMCLLISVGVSFCSAWRCLLPKHPYVDRSQLIRDRTVHEFRRWNSGNYSQIVIDESRNAVIVGAKDYLFSLNGNDLQLNKEIRWSSTARLRRCNNSGLEKDICQNHINLLVPFGEKLLVCGSGLSKPLYNVTVLGNLSTTHDANRDGYGVCSGSPSEQGIGIVTRFGDVISATGSNSRMQGPMISMTPLPAEDSDADPIRTDQYDIKLLNGPQFVAAFDVFPEVFIFFNEKAMERNMEMTATLGRVCQTDNGGSDFVLEKGWTTYRKLRLGCTVPGKSDVRFTRLEHFVHEKEVDLFHGIFRTSSSSYHGSVICSFHQKDIENAFDGNFLSKSEDGKSWNTRKNKMHFTGCKTNASSLIQGFPEVSGKMVPFGKEPTNFLTFDALSDSFYYQLMADNIKSSNVINFDSSTDRFTHLALMTVPSLTTPHRIFFVATVAGALLKVYQPHGGKRACILSETQITESEGQKILSLELSADKTRLYIGLTNAVMTVPTSKCDAHVTESECLTAHDPTCGWSAADAKCLSWTHFNWTANTTSPDAWRRDLTSCPSYQASWSQWSEWDVCKQGNLPGGLCECRHRQCRGCQVTDCAGPSTETRNCSASLVVDVSDWRVNGVVNGAWSAWFPWSQCGVGSCGHEFVSRNRSCTNPAPRNGGTGCTGSSEECKLCVPLANAVTCPPNWGPWNGWSVCENTSLSDEGVQSRRRNCFGTGACEGDEEESRRCFVGAVTWGPWSDCRCDVTGLFGTGMAYRQPQCLASHQSFGDCPTHWIEFQKCQCNDVNEVFPTPASRADGEVEVKSSMIDIKYVILTAALTGLVCVILCIAVVCICMKRKKGGHSIAGNHDSDIKMDIKFAAKFVKVETVAESPEEQRYVTSKAINKKNNYCKRNNLTSPRNEHNESLLNGNHGNVDIQRNSIV